MSRRTRKRVGRRAGTPAEDATPWLPSALEIPLFSPEPQVLEEEGLDLQSRFSLTVATELAAFLPYVPDLDKLAPAKNQGSNSKACTSYAIASTLEDRLLLETPSIAFPVSPLYGHLCIAGKTASSPWDPGLAMKALAQAAIARETATEANDLPEQCGLRTGRVRLLNILQIKGDVDARREVQHGPVIAVMELWEDFQSEDYKGELYRHQNGLYGGLHTVEVVGFDAEGWVIKNSFGPLWGDRGFGKVAYGECRLFRHFAFSFQPKII